MTEATTGDCTPPFAVKALLKAFLSLRALKAAGAPWLTRTSCLSFRLGLAFWVFFCVVVHCCSLFATAAAAYDIGCVGAAICLLPCWFGCAGVGVGLSRRRTLSLSSFETFESEEI